MASGEGRRGEERSVYRERAAVKDWKTGCFRQWIKSPGEMRGSGSMDLDMGTAHSQKLSFWSGRGLGRPWG